jgi:ADP-Ribosyltransferase in polyvalent proteins/Large polyvalent protein associated domain 22
MGRWAEFSDEATAERDRAGADLAFRLRPELDPDSAAEATKLARRYRVPAGVAGEFREDYKARALGDDAAATLATAPKLGKWIGDDPMRAAIAQDDMVTLAGIEKTIGKLAGYVLGARPDSGLLGDVGRGVDLMARGGAAAMVQGVSGINEAFYDAIGAKRQATQQAAQGAQANAFIKAASENLIAQDTMLGRGVASGLVSSGQTMLALPLAAGRGLAQGGDAVIRLLAASQGGTSYAKARAEGFDPAKAGMVGVADAASEFVGEKYFGLGGLLKDAAAGMGVVRLFMRDVLREVPGEVGTTLSQNFNDWAILNPEKSVRDWIDEQPSAIGETIIATIVGAGAQTGAIRGVQKVMGDAARREATALQAEQTAQHIETLAKLASASLVVGRDATTAMEFIDQVADKDGESPAQFYADREQVATVLNQSGIALEELAAVAPIAAGQMAGEGGSVTIPMSEFINMAHKAPEATAALIDHLRTADDMPTRAEAREYLAGEGDKFKADIEAQMDRRGDADTFRADVGELQQRFKGELDALKRTTSEANTAYASLLANFYGATAVRIGMKPAELAEKVYRLRVASKLDPNRGPQRLSQDGTDQTSTPEFRKWFGASVVTEDGKAGGKPMVVYHGTASDFDVFEHGHPSKKDGGWLGKGFYFTDRPSVANSYTNLKAGSTPNVMPVYLSLKNPAYKEGLDAKEKLMFADLRGEHRKLSAETERLRAKGHDGIIWKPGYPDAPMEFVIFDPEQIKSAIGNSGAFDPTDPNILKQSAQPSVSRETIELRKRQSVLESLLECI